MTFDMVVTAIAYALFLFGWLPWKIIKHRKIIKCLKVRVRAYRFSDRYEMLKRLSSPPHFRSKS